MLLAMLTGHQAAALPPASHGRVTALRLTFSTAMNRVRSSQPDLTDSPALKAYPLYGYLVAARLRRDLSAAPGNDLDAQIDAFLQAHVHEPVARRLRDEWLASLARRARWDWFLPRSADSSAPVLVCDRLAGRLATGDTLGLAAAGLAQWLLPQRQPPECGPIFSWLRLAGALTQDLVESRVRAALAAGRPGLAREFLGDLPADRAAPLLFWADLLDAPKAALAALAGEPAHSVPPEALAAAFERLSHRDGTAAADLLPRLLSRPQTTPALRAQLLQSAALGAAYDHDPAAITAFAQVPPEAVDDRVAQWRVRAALWSGDYGRARIWLERLPPGLAALPRWQYWYARAVAATSGDAAAKPLYAEIARMRDYYGYLAADRLHRRFHLHARPSPNDAAAQRTLAARAPLVRAHELFECSMLDEATAEWTAGLAGADPALEIQAAHLAARWGWYTAAIGTLARSGEWDDLRLRYPRPYRAAVMAAHRFARLPADWILAVMRQESMFRPDAVSPADARGLMQMQPATAATVARRWHQRAPTPDGLFDPKVAARLGAAYLRDLLDRYGGQLALGLAAYNAGPKSVARWLPAKPMDADVWIENIPYGETRAYVEHIIEHIVAYAWTRGAPQPRLSRLLPRVEPAAASITAHLEREREK